MAVLPLSRLFWALVASGLPLLSASPTVWYTPSLRAKYLANHSQTLSCVDHPSQNYGGNSPHQSPLQNDSTIAFTFSAASGELTPLLCPGVEHTLQVSFGDTRRLGLLTADPPVVTFTSPAPTELCSNRVDLLRSNKTIAQTNYTTTFQVPCSLAGSDVEFKITTVVVGGDKRWRQNSVIMRVGSMGSLPTACAAAAALACACIPSTMGYDCMTTTGNVTVHWTVNSTAAPAGNGCTPSSPTVLQESEVKQSGTLHMAAQAAVTGYVAVGFAPIAKQMIPSDIILGWAGNDSIFLNTFDVRVPAVGATTNNTADSWAYDRGVALDTVTGITTICFTRRLNDDRAKSSPDLRGTTVLGLNWAVSPVDDLVAHQAGSVGGVWLDMVSGAQLLMQQRQQLTTNTPVQAPPPPAPAASRPACTPSTLGYDCMTRKDKVTLHWSVNKTQAPQNPCTPANRVTLSVEDLVRYGTLHLAVQAEVEGYVALGFSEDAHHMYPADIVLGWAGGSGPYIKTFHATAEALSEANLNPPANSGKTGWAYDMGVVRDTALGINTICFSRRLVDDSAIASRDLRASTGESHSSRQHLPARRLLEDDDDDHSGKGQLGLVWAVSRQNALVQHVDGNYGGFFLDMTLGSADGEASDDTYWIDVHGALMAVAWGLLLPLGTLLPAHRWLLRDAKMTLPLLGEKHVWFIVHVACQWSGMALFIAGFIVAFVHLEEGSGELGEAHKNIGIAIMAAAGAQVLVAYARPAPDSPRRGIWNLVHHNLGRVTVLLAWANVYIGIVVYHKDDGAEYREWITPIAVVMGLLAISDALLRIVGSGRNADIPAKAATYQPGSPNNGHVTNGAEPKA